MFTFLFSPLRLRKISQKVKRASTHWIELQSVKPILLPLDKNKKTIEDECPICFEVKIDNVSELQLHKRPLVCPTCHKVICITCCRKMVMLCSACRQLELKCPFCRVLARPPPHDIFPQFTTSEELMTFINKALESLDVNQADIVAGIAHTGL